MKPKRSYNARPGACPASPPVATIARSTSCACDVVQRLLHERGTDARALVVGVNGDHVDLAGAGGVFVEEPDGDEPHRTVVDDRDPDRVLCLGAHRPDRCRLR